MKQTINATQARENFSEIINRVVYLGEDFIVKKQGKPAVLITKINKTVHKKEDEKKIKTTEFLLKLSHYKLQGGPKNLAKNHDKYTWE